MSRRDTIIVAVLVNAALLMILFATALRSDRVEDPTASAPQLAQVESAPNQPQDELLNQYVTAVPTLAEPENFEEELELAYTPVDVPVAPVAAPPPAELKYVTVTVKQGDFLEKIARANNTTVATVMELNGLRSTNLKIGQVLKVPLSQGKPASQSNPVNEAEYYVVQDGDSPWLIASRNNIRLSELLRLNDLDDQKARRIRPGDKLRIR